MGRLAGARQNCLDMSARRKSEIEQPSTPEPSAILGERQDLGLPTERQLEQGHGRLAEALTRDGAPHMDMGGNDRREGVLPGRRLVDDGRSAALRNTKRCSRPQAGAESVSENLSRLILDVNDDADLITRPIGERYPFGRPGFPGCSGNQIAMRVPSRMAEMIREGIEVTAGQIVLCPFGCTVQSIEGQFGLVGKITFPQSVPSKDVQSPALARLGQLQQAGTRPQQSCCLQLLNQTQRRTSRPSKSTAEFHGCQRSAFLVGAVDLLERIFPQDVPTPASPATAEPDEPAQQCEPNKQPEGYCGKHPHIGDQHVDPTRKPMKINAPLAALLDSSQFAVCERVGSRTQAGAVLADAGLGIKDLPKGPNLRNVDLCQCAARMPSDSAQIAGMPGRFQMKATCFGALLVIVGTVSMPLAGYCQDQGQGKYWYLSYCASCHGISGKGDGSVAKVLTQKPTDLTTLLERNGGVFPAARIVETIDGRREVVAHGEREMPVWGRATRFAPVMVRTRIRAIVNYIATLQGK
jgi:mono/diheme cytochrome c family protein